MHPPVGNDELAAKLTQAAQLVREAKSLAVLTGAGISAESGLATFRGAGGLWEGHRVEDVATPRAFKQDPAMVWRFYNARRASLQAVQPNPGHAALVDLEKHFGPGNFTLITQNVDGLHQQAGSQHVLEIHGALRRVRCTGCGQVEDRGTQALPELPRCEGCQELLRPDVVWFEEMLPEDIWRQADEAVGSCQCFLVVGTSAVVYPAAGLIRWARDSRASIIEVNLTPTDASTFANVSLQGPSGKLLPELVKRLQPTPV
jgi:NAD-dependent deacetylase